MSYLVDALRKAERERHENRRADMSAVAGGGPFTPGGGSGRLLRWVVGLLVVCNVALLTYLLAPASLSEAFVDTAPDTPALDDTAQTAAADNTPVDTPAAADTSEPMPTLSMNGSQMPDNAERDTPAVDRTPTAGAETSSAAASPTLPPGRANTRQLRFAERAPSARRGQVTYSQTPLDAGSEEAPVASARSAPPSRDTIPPATRGGPLSSQGGAAVPEVTINGHLFSSVPGRSFILVEGRRYHEGERLASGPAVESIDAAGATLNYQGNRYHVDGPR